MKTSVFPEVAPAVRESEDDAGVTVNVGIGTLATIVAVLIVAPLVPATVATSIPLPDIPETVTIVGRLIPDESATVEGFTEHMPAKEPLARAVAQVRETIPVKVPEEVTVTVEVALVAPPGCRVMVDGFAVSV